MNEHSLNENWGNLHGLWRNIGYLVRKIKIERHLCRDFGCRAVLDIGLELPLLRGIECRFCKHGISAHEFDTFYVALLGDKHFHHHLALQLPVARLYRINCSLRLNYFQFG